MTTEGEGAQSGAEGSQSGAGDTGGTGNSGTETTTSTAGAQSGSQEASEAEKARQETEAVRERMKAADQRAAKFEAELKQLRDKDLPEQAKLQRDLQDATKKNEELAAVNQSLALKVAFLSDNEFSWHNPERALKLADLSSVEVNEDGSVTGLKQALQALAKSDAYLLKPKESAASEEEKKTPPGTAPGNNGSNGTGTPSDKALVARFPGLSTRVKRR